MKKHSYDGGMRPIWFVQIVLIILKLIGVINWSWWLVFIPSFIGVGLWLALVALLWFLIYHK